LSQEGLKARFMKVTSRRVKSEELSPDFTNGSYVKNDEQIRDARCGV